MTTQTDAPTLAFYGPETEPFEVRAGEPPQTPRGRLLRLSRAALEALPVALARREEHLSQTELDPITLVCAADCALGRSIIAAKMGPDAPGAVTGPCVFMYSPQELIGSFAEGKGIAEQLTKLEAKPGEMIWAFAVNGKQLDVRVMRLAPVNENERPALHIVKEA